MLSRYEAVSARTRELSTDIKAKHLHGSDTIFLIVLQKYLSQNYGYLQGFLFGIRRTCRTTDSLPSPFKTVSVLSIRLIPEILSQQNKTTSV